MQIKLSVSLDVVHEFAELDDKTIINLKRSFLDAPVGMLVTGQDIKVTVRESDK